jgi:hypothetical protein
MTGDFIDRMESFDPASTQSQISLSSSMVRDSDERFDRKVSWSALQLTCKAFLPFKEAPTCIIHSAA